MRDAVIASVAASVLAMLPGTASAQVACPGQPRVGDWMADQHRDAIELQRQRSAEQAAFARQYRLESRLTEMEIRSARAPEPYIPLAATPLHSPEAERQARLDATRRREAVAAGVGQVDDWLARPPR
ncbi:MAG: hypothetical protein KKA16_13050 [Alphaproteobacteria bacterium]|nr:hypothetical protein [Alphaproteobacteria bacterium]MBU2379129.1 hypothetical protein [Alphaproteobacteria bacterium]